MGTSAAGSPPGRREGEPWERSPRLRARCRSGRAAQRVLAYADAHERAERAREAAEAARREGYITGEEMDELRGELA